VEIVMTEDHYIDIEDSYVTSEKLLEILESDFASCRIDKAHLYLYEMVMETAILPYISSGKLIAKNTDEAKAFKDMYTNIFLDSYIISLVMEEMERKSYDDKTVKEMALRIKKVRIEKENIVKNFLESGTNHLDTDEIFEKFREIIC